jgi:peptidoglycan hydrolase-like protein with peptidoglycan-binding domain
VYTPSGVQGYRAVGRFIPRYGDARPGDVVFFDWQGGQSAGGTDHVGFVESVLPDGRIQTIEGNTSGDSNGSQSDGGGVWRRVRSRGNIVGFGRPNYQSGPVVPAPGPDGKPIDWAALRRMVAKVNLDKLSQFPNGTVLKRGDRNLRTIIVQSALNVISGTKLVEDGDYGPATQQAVTNFQRFFKLEADGVFGDKTRAMMMLCLKNIADGKA